MNPIDHRSNKVFEQVAWLIKKNPLYLVNSSYEEINRYFNEAFIPVYNRCYARPTLADNGFVPLPDNVERPYLIMKFLRKTDHQGRLSFHSQLYELYDEYGSNVNLIDTEIVLQEDIFKNTLRVYYGKQKLYPVLCMTVTQ